MVISLARLLICHLILPHGQKLLVDPRSPQECDNVAQELRAVLLNSLLFRPSHVVRFEHTLGQRESRRSSCPTRRTVAFRHLLPEAPGG